MDAPLEFNLSNAMWKIHGTMNNQLRTAAKNCHASTIQHFSIVSVSVSLRQFERKSQMKQTRVSSHPTSYAS